MAISFVELFSLSFSLWLTIETIMLFSFWHEENFCWPKAGNRNNFKFMIVLPLLCLIFHSPQPAESSKAPKMPIHHAPLLLVSYSFSSSHHHYHYPVVVIMNIIIIIIIIIDIIVISNIFIIIIIIFSRFFEINFCQFIFQISPNKFLQDHC